MDGSKRLHLAIFLPSLSSGGAERVIYNLILGLQNYDIKLDLLVTFEDGVWQKKLPENCNVINLNTKHVFQALFLLINYLKKQEPHILFSAIDNANLINILACKLSGENVKSVISIHQVSSEFRKLHKTQKEIILNQITKLVFPLTDRLVAVSQEIKKDIPKSIRISSDKVTVIGNPIIRKVELEKLSDIDRQKSDQPNIVAFGRLAIEKDFPTLIHAFHMFLKTQDGFLTIFGDGPERKSLMKLCLELGIENRVSLPGFVEDVFFYMNQADLCVVSSITEGFGNVIVEALACGVPVVSTDCGGPREILMDGEFGKLVPVKNVEFLKEAMLHTVREPHNPDFLRKRALDFTIEKITQEYMQLFEALLS